MAIGDKDRMLVESAIELGHNLGLTVVAEGVEDQATLRALELLGCDVAQGFYFAQALDGPTFQSWVRNYTTADAVEPIEALQVRAQLPKRERTSSIDVQG
jgi:EAL domain-containing protein (putative c-di-GMP-specific phosphodiesterase class I)